MIAFIFGVLLFVILWRACRPRGDGEIRIVVRLELASEPPPQTKPPPLRIVK